ncbi:hypothetical protein EDC04DRAFT_2614775 [Pisolithus marmoratus]|nr:hypothetical protein EDC04DRAFT_2614775 [Pisolithus marmoratus]
MNWLLVSGTFFSSSRIQYKKGFLHCDTCPFKILFRDRPDRGTIPFLAINLLAQTLDVLEQRLKSELEGTKGTHFYQQDEMISVQLNDDDFEVQHAPADDVNSLFYDIIGFWFCMINCWDGSSRVSTSNL